MCPVASKASQKHFLNRSRSSNSRVSNNSLWCFKFGSEKVVKVVLFWHFKRWTTEQKKCSRSSFSNDDRERIHKRVVRECVLHALPVRCRCRHWQIEKADWLAGKFMPALKLASCLPSFEKLSKEASGIAIGSIFRFSWPPQKWVGKAKLPKSAIIDVLSWIYKSSLKSWKKHLYTIT